MLAARGVKDIPAPTYEHPAKMNGGEKISQR